MLEEVASSSRFQLLGFSLGALGQGDSQTRPCSDPWGRRWMHPLGKLATLPWTRFWAQMLERGSKHSLSFPIWARTQRALHAIGQSTEGPVLSVDHFARLSSEP